MPSTLQNIMGSVDLSSLPVPLDRIFYGYNTQLDANTTPFVTLTDFKQVPTYDTGGVVMTTSTFILHVYANRLELAETLALGIDAQLNLSATLTPTTVRCLQESYEVVQEDYYVFHVAVAYSLIENG